MAFLTVASDAKKFIKRKIPAANVNIIKQA